MLKANHMELSIRSVGLECLDELSVIETQCFKKEAFSKQHIAYFLEDSSCICLAAHLHGEIVGFVIGQIDFDENIYFGHIITLDVLPFYQRKGIASQLLKEIESIFRRFNLRECRLEVKEDNFAALALYCNDGYVPIAKLKNYYLNTHGLYLKKVL